MAKKKRVRIAKYMGDDRYSWAVFVDDYPVYTGCGRDEARSLMEDVRKRRGIV